MPLAVVAALELGAERDQRPQRDEGDQPDCDHAADQPRVERLLVRARAAHVRAQFRSEEHTSALQSLMRISYAVLCLKQKQQPTSVTYTEQYRPHYQHHDDK